MKHPAWFEKTRERDRCLVGQSRNVRQRVQLIATQILQRNCPRQLASAAPLLIKFPHEALAGFLGLEPVIGAGLLVEGRREGGIGHVAFHHFGRGADLWALGNEGDADAVGGTRRRGINDVVDV